jgi:putative Mn2+ efflux pump MntP
MPIAGSLAAVLSLDSLVVAFSLGPLQVGRRRELVLGLTFGLADALALLVGRTVGSALPAEAIERVAPAAILAYAAGVLILVATRRARLLRGGWGWSLVLLPILLSADNLLAGIYLEQDWSLVPLAGLVSAALALVGFKLGAMLARTPRLAYLSCGTLLLLAIKAVQ